MRILKTRRVWTPQTLRETIGRLEGERVSLMVKIEKLMKMGDSKVSALENEISMLREDLKSLKELLE